jgi:hypothetical protein
MLDRWMANATSTKHMKLTGPKAVGRGVPLEKHAIKVVAYEEQFLLLDNIRNTTCAVACTT